MTEATLLWDKRPRQFELEKLELALLISQEAPVGLSDIKLSTWLARELEKYPELFDEELFEGSRYAVAIARNLWNHDSEVRA